MFRRILTLTLAVSSITVSGLEAQGLLKSLLNSLEEEVEERAQEFKRDLEATAEVRKIDYSVTPSYVVETDDGRRFQLSGITFLPDADLTALLPLVDRMEFRNRGNESYQVNIAFREIPESGGLAESLARGAVNRTARSEEYSSRRANVTALEGTALNGAVWYLRLRGKNLRSVLVIR